MSARQVVIRRMHQSDVAGAIALIRLQHWNQTEDDWRRFLALEPEGCFVGTLDGAVIATTTTELFGAVGWIGMVAVASELRGGGIGRAMMDAAIAYLRRRGARCIKLDATSMGKPLYEHMGFVAEYRNERWARVAEPLSTDGVVPVSVGQPPWQSALDVDRRAYHVDRAHMLAQLARDWPDLAAVHVTDGRVNGYVVGRHGHSYEFVGPLVATSQGAAEQLLRWAMSRTAGRQVVIDRPEANEAACELVGAYAFEPVREFTRMHLGQEPYLDQPCLIYGTSGAEKG